MRDQRAFLAQLWALDELLGRHGYPRFSPWWRATIEDFYLSGARQGVIRKGRRVGASTIIAPRIAVTEALHGQHRFSPGDRAAFAFISVKRTEAEKRKRNIAAILDLLGVRYSTPEGALALEDYPINFEVLTASYRTAVGDTCIGVWADEVSRWLDSDTGANPAREVLSSVRPTIATLPDARMWLVSSPLGTTDAHAAAVDQGDTVGQRVYCGATWEINPTLSEADTRALEPHEAMWQREYAAIPSDSTLENYFGMAIDRCVVTEPIPRFNEIEYTCAVDPAFSQQTSDRFGFAVVASTVSEWDEVALSRKHPRMTRVHAVGAWVVDRSPREMAQRLKREVCDPFGISTVLTDQFEGFSWAQLAKDIGLRVKLIPWTGGATEGSKADRYSRVRRELYDGQLQLPNDPAFIRELRSVRSVLLPGGGERIEVPRTKAGHGDMVSAFVLATSEVLAKRPQLPPTWERLPERIERLEREANWRQVLACI